ncbi:MAG: class IV adenylate cyclase [Candidatus Angelobacter sp. Gp1-AA117]|nr:MAG: class IV adenylate cyclase [Candidatus Angelobacter sp. Gp1-AA117]
MPQEVEIKFRIDDVAALPGRLHACGFQLKTPRTHEMNVLYDLPGQPLRQKGEILRIREYGGNWTITYKSKGTEGRHKSRREIETHMADGKAMTEIMEALGFSASFRYEKFRTEWSDGHGHVVVDETPIGNFGEIEGTAEWIDKVAERLKISPEQYITSSYAQLFFLWKQQNGSHANEMTFAAVG